MRCVFERTDLSGSTCGICGITVKFSEISDMLASLFKAVCTSVKRGFETDPCLPQG